MEEELTVDHRAELEQLRVTMLRERDEEVRLNVQSVQRDVDGQLARERKACYLCISMIEG